MINFYKNLMNYFLQFWWTFLKFDEPFPFLCFFQLVQTFLKLFYFFQFLVFTNAFSNLCYLYSNNYSWYIILGRDYLAPERQFAGASALPKRKGQPRGSVRTTQKWTTIMPSAFIRGSKTSKTCNFWLECQNSNPFSLLGFSRRVLQN